MPRLLRSLSPHNSTSPLAFATAIRRDSHRYVGCWAWRVCLPLIDVIRRRTCFLWDPTLTAGPAAANRHPTSTLQHHTLTLAARSRPTNTVSRPNHISTTQPWLLSALTRSSLTSAGTSSLLRRRARPLARTTACDGGAPWHLHGDMDSQRRLPVTFR